jgi:hypothetical protein
MSVQSLRRAAALTLLVLLAMASSAQAASAASPSGILELLWGQIAGGLSKAGCTLDPNGARCVKNGCTLDPNGGTCPKHIPASIGGLRDPGGRAFWRGTF